MEIFCSLSLLFTPSSLGKVISCTKVTGHGVFMISRSCYTVKGYRPSQPDLSLGSHLTINYFLACFMYIGHIQLHELQTFSFVVIMIRTSGYMGYIFFHGQWSFLIDPCTCAFPFQEFLEKRCCTMIITHNNIAS